MTVLLAVIVVVACAVLLVQAYIQMSDQKGRYEAALREERDRVNDLMDRLQAGSLEQYHAMQRAAAQPLDDDVSPGRWVHDETGLISAFVPDGE